MAKIPPKGKELDADDYLAAAQDHAVALSSVYTHGDYALTIYVAGVAVECLFRAFREKKGLPFRSDHPLSDMAAEAGFPDIIPERQRERFGAAMGDLIVRWRNSHRFRSNQAMRRFLKGLRLDRRLKGDFLKENARLVSSSAIDLVSLGVQRWRH
jgi:hypothetical protein